jgi:lipoate-protein ligase A
MTTFRLLRHGPSSGPWNMAVDEVLLDQAVALPSQPGCLRLYRWREPTVSLGYFQSYDDYLKHAPSKDYAVVRRLTGGGAIVHDAELTYSIVLPAWHPLAARRDELYAAAHEELVGVLGKLGIQADLSAGQAQEGDEPFLCFQRRATGDVLLSGMKIAGSAQRRRNGAVLQHGSILLRRSLAAEALPGLVDLSGKGVSEDELAELWLPELGRRFGIVWQESELSEPELQAADELANHRYAWPGWTEQRARE